MDFQWGKDWVPAGVYPRESGGGDERMERLLLISLPRVRVNQRTKEFFTPSFVGTTPGKSYMYDLPLVPLRHPSLSALLSSPQISTS